VEWGWLAALPPTTPTKNNMNACHSERNKVERRIYLEITIYPVTNEIYH